MKQWEEVGKEEEKITLTGIVGATCTGTNGVTGADEEGGKEGKGTIRRCGRLVHRNDGGSQKQA